MVLDNLKNPNRYKNKVKLIKYLSTNVKIRAAMILVLRVKRIQNSSYLRRNREVRQWGGQVVVPLHHHHDEAPKSLQEPRVRPADQIKNIRRSKKLLFFLRFCVRLLQKHLDGQKVSNVDTGKQHLQLCSRCCFTSLFPGVFGHFSL